MCGEEWHLPWAPTMNLPMLCHTCLPRGYLLSVELSHENSIGKEVIMFNYMCDISWFNVFLEDLYEFIQTKERKETAKGKYV